MDRQYMGYLGTTTWRREHDTLFNCKLSFFSNIDLDIFRRLLEGHIARLLYTICVFDRFAEVSDTGCEHQVSRTRQEPLTTA
jgi:hypothetical protein